MNAKELFHLTTALRNESWTADYNPLLDLPREELLRRLGATPPEGERTLAERERHASRAYAELFKEELWPFPPLMLGVDWRSYRGHNWISGVKDQGGCGSCVAFGTCATIDAMMRISSNSPLGTLRGFELQDVSEAQMYYCSKTSSDQHNCASGWWPTSAFAYAENTGLAPESCFPYTAGDQPCTLCPDWASKLTKAGGTVTLTTIAAMQNWVAERGPLETCFTVYDDFFAYSGGVYKHVTGAVAGGHCVCCIGYSVLLRAWLCKNSWGPTWGMGGYFWIGFGQCGIDAQMIGVDSFTQIHRNPIFIRPEPPLGSSLMER